MLAEERPVFNIPVADAHCYYANDVLVHNCDSLAWAIRGNVLAALLGLAFVAVKIFEYTLEARAGIGSLGALAELYFLVTGFHLLHVVFGAAVLLLVARRPSQANVVTIATLWHAIDLVWLVMFPIVYLT